MGSCTASRHGRSLLPQRLTFGRGESQGPHSFESSPLPSLFRREEVGTGGHSNPQAATLALLRCRSVPAAGGLSREQCEVWPLLRETCATVCRVAHSFVVIGRVAPAWQVLSTHKPSPVSVTARCQTYREELPERPGGPANAHVITSHRTRCFAKLCGGGPGHQLWLWMHLSISQVSKDLYQSI